MTEAEWLALYFHRPDMLDDVAVLQQKFLLTPSEMTRLRAWELLQQYGRVAADIDAMT